MSLIEIRWNQWLPVDHAVSDALKDDSSLMEQLCNAGRLTTEHLHRAQKILEVCYRHAVDFREKTAALDLPMPLFFNADSSVAKIVAILSLSTEADVVIETGVGYGLTTTIVLSVMMERGKGHLTSIDLPVIKDPSGYWTGRLVPEELKSRWQLVRGHARCRLSRIVRNQPKIDLFISDSANVFTMQRFELRTVLPRMSERGALVFNNIGSRILAHMRRQTGWQVFAVEQKEKAKCVTAVMVRRS